MVPFRVFDTDKKEMWIVLNYQPNDSGGKYLMARESDDESDGEMMLMDAGKMPALKLIDFLDESEAFSD
jgi:hypothetical protein